MRAIKRIGSLEDLGTAIQRAHDDSLFRLSTVIQAQGSSHAGHEDEEREEQAKASPSSEVFSEDEMQTALHVSSNCVSSDGRDSGSNEEDQTSEQIVQAAISSLLYQASKTSNGYEALIGKSDSKMAYERGRVSLDTSSRASSMDLGPCGPSTGHLAEGHAAQELFYRLNHARQTVDFVRRQTISYGRLNRGEMGVWDSLRMLNQLREYEAALVGTGPSDSDADLQCDPDMPLMEHAIQTAEACRLAFPDHDWMALVGLIHGLGKLMAHEKFGAEPQWAICGESFPVGCRFHPAVVHSQFFQANPDRRRRALMTPTGMYSMGCGLSSVMMSWSHAEYLYMVLVKNGVVLPPQAMFLIRFQKFASLFRSNKPYNELLSRSDRALLPLLKRFRELSVYKQQEIPGKLSGEEFFSFYDSLISKYIPQKKLRW